MRHTRYGFGHGRSGLIPSSLSGSLLTNSNEPMSWPELHILFVCRNCWASTAARDDGTPCISAAGIEDNNDDTISPTESERSRGVSAT